MESWVSALDLLSLHYGVYMKWCFENVSSNMLFIHIHMQLKKGNYYDVTVAFLVWLWIKMCVMSVYDTHLFFCPPSQTAVS